MHRQDINLFTPAEAAWLSGLTLKAVNNTIDKKMVAARIEQRNGHATRMLDKPAIIYLFLQSRLAGKATSEFRRRIFAAIAAAPARRFVSVGDLKLDLREPRREVARRIKELCRAKRIIVSDPEILGGTPVFRRTRVPVHLIADLLQRGGTPGELRESYPCLTDEIIRLAQIYTATHPPRGRPRKHPWEGMASHTG